MSIAQCLGGSTSPAPTCNCIFHVGIICHLDWAGGLLLVGDILLVYVLYEPRTILHNLTLHNLLTIVHASFRTETKACLPHILHVDKSTVGEMVGNVAGAYYTSGPMLHRMPDVTVLDT